MTTPIEQQIRELAARYTADRKDEMAVTPAGVRPVDCYPWGI